MTWLQLYGAFVAGTTLGVITGGWFASQKHIFLREEIVRLDRLVSWYRHGSRDLATLHEAGIDAGPGCGRVTQR